MGATVTRLRPIRTLTIARDLGFRQRATIVLAELGPTGFAVMALEPAAAVAALVVKLCVDVVVLDVTASEPALPVVVSELAECAPHVGVVAVGGSADRSAQGLRVLPKWTWATELTHAVQDAHRRGSPLLEDRSGVGSQQA